MARESTQHKLDRVRPPRVQITYDVETGGAIEVKELPFVMGVLGDFTGQPVEPLARLRDRKFTEVNPDNFDQVLAGMKPHLAFSVENKLSDEADAGQLKVDLHFKSMDDFDPENVARQVKPIRELLAGIGHIDIVLGVVVDLCADHQCPLYIVVIHLVDQLLRSSTVFGIRHGGLIRPIGPGVAVAIDNHGNSFGVDDW
jgi:type VI secretion system protein ImpB